MFFGEASQSGLKLRASYIYRFTALLAESMVVMGSEDFTKFNLMLEAVPNAVNNAELLKEFNGTVHGGTVNIAAYGRSQAAYAHGAVLGQGVKDSNAALGGASFRLFEGSFDFLYTYFHIVSI